MKSAIKGQGFQDIEDIQKKSNDGTESSSTTGVPKMFPVVEHCWAKCVAIQGEYFKGDPSQ
jgi:hypothetical protein